MTRSPKQPKSYSGQRVSSTRHSLASPSESPHHIESNNRASSISSDSSSTRHQETGEIEQQQQQQQQQQQESEQEDFLPSLPSPSASSSTSPISFPQARSAPQADHHYKPSAASESFEAYKPESRTFSPPPTDRSRRSASHACRTRTPLDAHRRLPRAVTPDLLPAASRERLYSPMAAGFARLGQKHRQSRTQRRPSVALSAAVAGVDSARHQRSRELRESMALVAKLFDGPA